MVILIDDRHLLQVTQLVLDLRPRTIYTAIVPINSSFLGRYVHAWSLLERERDLMVSDAYLRQVPPSLRHLPEHTVPSYTLINHAKIDFIMFVINHLHGRQNNHGSRGHSNNNIIKKPTVENPGLSPASESPRYQRYSWIDFGYLHADHFMPQGPFRPHLLSPDNITYMTLRPLGDNDDDITYPYLAVLSCPNLSLLKHSQICYYTLFSPFNTYNH